jgi:hypothetical protein
MYADIQPNADAFARALEELGEKIEQDVFEKVIRKALFDLMGEIMNGTPVDTGRARGSWSMGTDWSEWELPEGDYGNMDMNAALSQVMSRFPISDHYVLFNNLEYIQALEEGHSKQAPAGFVAKALAAMTEYLGRAAKSMGYEVTA